MSSALLVSSKKTIDGLAEIIKPLAYDKTVSATSGAEARRIALNNEFDTVFINAPLSDEFGHELSLSIASSMNAGVILMVKGEMADEVSHRVEKGGVFVVSKPLYKPVFYQAVNISRAARVRVLGLQKENLKLQTKIEDLKFVNRAKCVLIQYLNMTEAQAHRYIEKQAMDMRLSKREIADKIISTYDR